MKRGGLILRHLPSRFVTTMQSGVQKPEVVNYIWRSCGETARLDKHDRGRSGRALNTHGRMGRDEGQRKFHLCLNVIGRRKTEA